MRQRPGDMAAVTVEMPVIAIMHQDNVSWAHERQPADGVTGDRDMATMRRIKCAPKEGDTHRASYRDGCILGPL